MTTMEAVLPMAKLGHLAPGERAAEFFERRGRGVFEGAGAWWTSIDTGSRSFLSCAEYAVLDAKPGEVSAALGRRNGIAAQYASKDPGCPSGVFMLDDPAYNIEHAQKRMRNFIRRGLKQFEIRAVEKHELLERGILINVETMARHDTFRSEFSEPAQWRLNVEAIYGMDGTVCMGAYENGLLQGYVFGVIDNGVLLLMVMKTVDSALERHANPALIFETARAAFATGQVRAISLGTMPFLNSPRLHQFKERMGFALQPYSMRIQLHPALELFAGKTLVGLAARFGGRFDRQAKLLQLGKGYVAPAVESKEENDDAGS